MGAEGDYDKQEDEENVGVEGSDYVHDEAIEGRPSKSLSALRALHPCHAKRMAWVD